MTRTSSGLNDHSYGACIPQSGEILKSAFHSDTQGILVFEVKYGACTGYRTVVLSAPTATDSLKLVTSAFADQTAKAAIIEGPKVPWTSILDYHPETIVVSEPTPADAISQMMSYTFHVRNLGDNRVICSTNSLADAKRIVAALPNTAIWQFRDSRSYDTDTLWMVK